MIQKKHPYEVEFTRQAVLVDKDFFRQLLSRPYLARGRFDSDEVDGTIIRELKPEDPEFLANVLGDLPMKGYLALENKEKKED
jgi:hypothetical protein